MNYFNKNVKRTVSALLAFVFCLLIVASPVQPKVEAASAEEQALRDELNNYSSEAKKIEKELNSIKSDLSKATDYKKSLDSLANTTQSKIAVAEALSAEIEQNIAATEADIEAKTAEINATFEKFLDRLCASYEEGDASYLSILLGSESMTEFLSRMDMVSSMLEYDRKLKEAYKEEKEALEAKMKELEEDKAAQEETLKTLESDKARLDSLQSEQSSYINSLQSDAAAAQKQYEAAKAEEARIDAEIKELLRKQEEEQKKNNSGNVVVGSGVYAWPLPGYTYISSHFGWRTLGGRRDYHLGIDIPASYGTAIVAADDGVVLQASYRGTYGNFVLISHGNGVATAYAHLSSFNCKAGQTVTKGQTIGKVGSTGNSTGNHLHFEVRINGETVNPLGYVT